jgi:hypothetical protein
MPDGLPLAFEPRILGACHQLFYWLQNTLRLPVMPETSTLSFCRIFLAPIWFLGYVLAYFGLSPYLAAPDLAGALPAFYYFELLKGFCQPFSR